LRLVVNITHSVVKEQKLDKELAHLEPFSTLFRNLVKHNAQRIHRLLQPLPPQFAIRLLIVPGLPILADFTLLPTKFANPALPSVRED